MLPDIQPGNTKILYFFNCLLDGMHTKIYKDINCKREIYFFFSSTNRSSRFAINLRELLSCLEDAEVQGDIPELSTEWWNEIGKIYPEFRKEVEKETDDIGPTLQ